MQPPEVTLSGQSGASLEEQGLCVSMMDSEGEGRLRLASTTEKSGGGGLPQTRAALARAPFCAASASSASFACSAAFAVTSGFFDISLCVVIGLVGLVYSALLFDVFLCFGVTSSCLRSRPSCDCRSSGSSRRAAMRHIYIYI